MKYHKHDDLTKVPQGTVSLSDQKLQIAPVAGGTPQTVPVGNVQNVVPQDNFLHAFHRKKISEGWKGAAVPEVLLSGNHAAIARWRRKQALGRTWERRPELVDERALSKEDRALLEEYRAERPER